MDGILGQVQALHILRSALRTQRLHHAYIFHGPEGVGKFTTALALGRVLLCHKPVTDPAGHPIACNRCQACRLPQGSHPDLHIVTKELARYHKDPQVRNRKLRNIPASVLSQALIEPVYRAAQLGRSKLFIVDEAELLDPVGQNKLLKTLEEPPPQTYLILVTSHDDKLLATVRSRCQRVGFVPLDNATLSRCLDATDTIIPNDQRQWLLSFACGSPGRAQIALQYNMFAWAHEVLGAIDAMTRDAGRKAGRYPTQLGAQITGFIDDFAKQWVDNHENASKEAANRRGAALMWSMIAQHAQSRLGQLAGTCDTDNPGASESLLEPCMAIINALGIAERNLASNVNMRLVTDHLVSLLYGALGGAGESIPVQHASIV